jgi:hypothetical protein
MFEAVAASNEPPPVRNTAPCGKPRTVPLNPKPWRVPAWTVDAANGFTAEYDEPPDVDGPVGVAECLLQAAPARAANTTNPAVMPFICDFSFKEVDGAVHPMSATLPAHRRL